MTDRAEQGAPESTQFMPWRILIPIAAVIFAVMPVALASVSQDPILLWRLLVVAVGAVACNRLAGVIQRQCEDTAEAGAADTEQAGR